MRYLIETKMSGFLQFVSLPESGDTWAYPEVAQIRGYPSLLERLDELLAQAQNEIKFAEDNFHEKASARLAFEGGQVLHSPGDPLLVVTIQRRQVCVMAGATMLLKHVADLERLRKVVRATIRKLNEDI